VNWWLVKTKDQGKNVVRHPSTAALGPGERADRSGDRDHGTLGVKENGL
jgi:hypothetical protein